MRPDETRVPNPGIWDTLWTPKAEKAEFWNPPFFFSKGRNALERVAAGLPGGFRRARVGPFGL